MAICVTCGEQYPLGVPCPGCGEPVTALAIERSVGAGGEISCNHRLLSVTFRELDDGRYRAVAFDDAEIHSCLTEKQRAEIAQFDSESWFSQLVTEHADGVIRREDVEGDEAWNRLSGKPDLFGVEAIRHEGAGWQVTFWVLQHVREEPLESQLRAAIDRSLRAVADVADVREEDREIYWVTGSPSGEDLVRAAAAVVDDLADELRVHCDGLGC